MPYDQLAQFFFCRCASPIGTEGEHLVRKLARKGENHCIQADLIAQPLDVIGVFEDLIRGQINSREPIIGHLFPSFRIYIRRRI